MLICIYIVIPVINISLYMYIGKRHTFGTAKTKTFYFIHVPL